MHRLRAFLENWARGTRILLLVLLANTVYALMLLVTIPAVSSHAGGLPILDLRPLGYDAAEVTLLFDQLGEEGRKAYLGRQIPADTLYPGLFAFAYSLLMALVLKSLGLLQRGGWVIACLLPVCGGLADYAENVGIVSLLLAYPDIDQRIVWLTSWCSIVKSISTTLYFFVLIGLLVALVTNYLRRALRST